MGRGSTFQLKVLMEVSGFSILLRLEQAPSHQQDDGRCFEEEATGQKVHNAPALRVQWAPCARITLGKGWPYGGHGRDPPRTTNSSWVHLFPHHP